ncbi:hypothetical protein LCGC14_0437350 [marine sediment metagenome]|uniref:Uncharacterized protein n=1 Tax=marine sediment metagenome TaxID=412755 RepID=A0A0F9SSM4_9ZZZZ
MGRNKKYWVPAKHLRKIINAVHHAIDRCGNPLVINYNAYGGRGIKVWEEWIKQPEWFAAYLCTLPGWTNHSLTIDRINNDKGYVPGNLRWATHKEQSKNTQRYTGMGRGTETNCSRCGIHFIRRREYQKFCSRLCAAHIGAAKRWGN